MNAVPEEALSKIGASTELPQTNPAGRDALGNVNRRHVDPPSSVMSIWGAAPGGQFSPMNPRCVVANRMPRERQSPGGLFKSTTFRCSVVKIVVHETPPSVDLTRRTACVRSPFMSCVVCSQPCSESTKVISALPPCMPTLEEFHVDPPSEVRYTVQVLVPVGAPTTTQACCASRRALALTSWFESIPTGVTSTNVFAASLVCATKPPEIDHPALGLTISSGPIGPEPDPCGTADPVLSRDRLRERPTAMTRKIRAAVATPTRTERVPRHQGGPVGCKPPCSGGRSTASSGHNSAPSFSRSCRISITRRPPRAANGAVVELAWGRSRSCWATFL